ncbi:hypothetical protein [Hyphomicrobium sp. CS1GBMeth3]|uniref:hypothetical protein n=1 Tax=Hyphomicrobium sp. CS1GBMeth3 TaxID=1892845 RepID=UPI001114EA9E|nr:hypothetical protein [Hyphomicrobium sp. CS1GBMeth3]
MSSRNWFASSLMRGLLVFGIFCVAPVAEAKSSKQAAQKSRESARTYVLESKRRVQRRARKTRIYLPVGPSYIYYDYPYYYSRGHYPTHIGGYVYYYPKSRNRCSGSNRRCVVKSGNSPVASRRQKGACRCR